MARRWLHCFFVLYHENGLLGFLNSQWGLLVVSASS
jgi:hypothetical protein